MGNKLKDTIKEIELRSLAVAVLGIAILVLLATYTTNNFTPGTSAWNPVPITGKQIITPQPWGDINPYIWEPSGNEEVLVSDISRSPSIYGDTVVYELHISNEFNWLDSDIYAIDVQTRKITPICIASDKQEDPHIYGKYVVWTDHRDKDDNNVIDIYYADISDLDNIIETNITNNDSGNYSNNASVQGDNIVWLNDTDVALKNELKLYNISTGSTRIIEPFNLSQNNYKTNPMIFDDIVVWTETDPVGYPESQCVYVYNLETNIKSVLDPYMPNYKYATDIYNNFLTWSDVSDYPEIDVILRNMKTGLDQNLTNNISESRDGGAALSKDLIVWSHAVSLDDPYSIDIYVHKISDPVGVNYPITDDAIYQRNPDVYGNVIVWEDFRYDDPGTMKSESTIWMFELNN